jgi:hypothetical protein
MTCEEAYRWGQTVGALWALVYVVVGGAICLAGMLWASRHGGGEDD